MTVYDVQLSKTYRVRAEDAGNAGEMAAAYFKQDLLSALNQDFDIGFIWLGMETTITVKGGD